VTSDLPVPLVSPDHVVCLDVLVNKELAVNPVPMDLTDTMEDPDLLDLPVPKVAQDKLVSLEKKVAVVLMENLVSRDQTEKTDLKVHPVNKVLLVFQDNPDLKV